MTVSKNMFLFLLIFILIPSLANAYGQNSGGISANTNKESYELGDKVVITGSVQQVVDGIPVTIIIRNPIGNVYNVGQVPLLNNLFVHDFVIRDNSEGGTYTVNIKHGNQTGQIHFVVNVGQLTIIPVLDNEIRVRANNTNLIQYGNAQVSTRDNSITIPIDTHMIKTGPIEQEFQIPKKVIDSTIGDIVVKEDENQIQCTQTEADTERILDCPIQNGVKQLKFVGTTVIPEFGSISTAILAVSISTILVISSRYKIR